MCRNSPGSQRHQWLVFLMRREKSLDPENGRKKELYLGQFWWEATYEQPSTHPNYPIQKILIKDCLCNFQSFVILYIHETVREDNNWRTKTQIAHNFFWMCQSLLNYTWPTFHGTSRMQETMSLREKNYTEQTATQPARISIYFSFLNYLAKRTEVYISEDQMKLGTCLIKTSFWRVYNFNPDFLTFSVMEILFTFSKHQSTAVPVGLQARSLHSLCFIIWN